MNTETKPIVKRVVILTAVFLPAAYLAQTLYVWAAMRAAFLRWFVPPHFFDWSTWLFTHDLMDCLHNLHLQMVINSVVGAPVFALIVYRRLTRKLNPGRFKGQPAQNPGDRPGSNRVAHLSAILGCLLLAATDHYLLAGSLVGGFGFAVLKLVELPFLLAGIRMHPSDFFALHEGVGILASVLAYSIPYAIFSVFFNWRQKAFSKTGSGIKSFFCQAPLWDTLLGGLIFSFQLIVAWSFHLFFPIVVFIVEPDDYMMTGQESFFILSLVFNTLVVMFIYLCCKHLFRSAITGATPPHSVILSKKSFRPE